MERMSIFNIFIQNKDDRPEADEKLHPLVVDGIEDLLLHALKFLKARNDELPCRENSLAITHIEEAVMWLAVSEADRKKQKVLGTKEK